ncbi:nicotinamide N-methyltransferase-like [Lissotriton helveticus]
MASFSEPKELHDLYLDATAPVTAFIAKDSALHDDAITRMLPSFNKIFSSGAVKGELLIELSHAPFFHWTFPACDYFSDIVLGGSTDQCVAVIEKWWRNEPGALDWSHAAKALCELQGNRDAWPEKQYMLQRKIKNVLKYNACKTNPLSPTILPLANCLILPHFLETHVTNKDEFCRALKNVSSLVKDGGHLILIAGRDTTYYVVGGFKFPHLCMDESLIRKTLVDANYVIKLLQVFPRKVYELYDVIDYSSAILVHAQKNTPVKCTYES